MGPATRPGQNDRLQVKAKPPRKPVRCLASSSYPGARSERKARSFAGKQHPPEEEQEARRWWRHRGKGRVDAPAAVEAPRKQEKRLAWKETADGTTKNGTRLTNILLLNRIYMLQKHHNALQHAVNQNNYFSFFTRWNAKIGGIATTLSQISRQYRDNTETIARQ